VVCEASRAIPAAGGVVGDQSIGGMNMSERFTVSIEPLLAAEFDEFIQRKGYHNRSEAVRDLIRDALSREALDDHPDRPCVGVLNYLYDHHARELSKKLTQVQHVHHDLTVTTLHMHVNADHCVESVLLKGSAREVLAFAESVMVRPGILHGHLHRIPIVDPHPHDPHPHDAHPHDPPAQQDLPARDPSAQDQHIHAAVSGDPGK
jgi:CopG family nickel-responsive transcriptional regulator